MTNTNIQEIARRMALEPLLRKIKELPRITLIKHNQGHFLACPCGNIEQAKFTHYKKWLVEHGKYELACMCSLCKSDTLTINILNDKNSFLPPAPDTTWITGYVPSLRDLWRKVIFNLRRKWKK